MSEGESRLAAYIYACVKSVLGTINIPSAIILTPGKKIVFFIGLCMHVFRLCNYMRAYVRACVRVPMHVRGLCSFVSRIFHAFCKLFPGSIHVLMLGQLTSYTLIFFLQLSS